MTRPEPAASRTGRRLAEMGYEPVLLPLARAVSLASSLPDAHFDAVAVTSANAFLHMEAATLRPFTALPLFAVGARTAHAARNAGFARVTEGGGDAGQLAATMREVLPAQARILYLAGRRRQPLFEERIAASGLVMTVRQVYDMERIAYAPDTFVRLFADGNVLAALLYSGAAAASLAQTMPENAPFFSEATRFFCISDRVAAQLPENWRARALIADQPDEDGLFGLFAKL